MATSGPWLCQRDGGAWFCEESSPVTSGFVNSPSIYNQFCEEPFLNWSTISSPSLFCEESGRHSAQTGWGLSHSEVSRFCDDPNVWHPIETIRFVKNRDSIRHKQLSCMDDVFCEECLHHKIAFPTEMLSQKRFAHLKTNFLLLPTLILYPSTLPPPIVLARCFMAPKKRAPPGGAAGAKAKAAKKGELTWVAPDSLKLPWMRAFEDWMSIS